MKRYLVFFYKSFYPDGGMNDFLLAHDHKDDAVKHLTNVAKAQAAMLDIDTSEITGHLGGHVYDLQEQRITFFLSEEFKEFPFF